MSDQEKVVKKRKIFNKNPEYTKQLGDKLRTRRLDSGFTLEDMAFMTDISKKTCIDIEKGAASGIDYYIEYARALNYELPELFIIDIEYQPRHKLSEKDLKRVSLAKKIRGLISSDNCFQNETYVSEIKTLLLSKQLVKDYKKLSSDISGILLSWTKEDAVLSKRKVESNNNVYKLLNLR